MKTAPRAQKGVNDQSINLPLRGGTTPLGAAVAERAVDRVKLLLEQGADPNVKDLTGRTPLIIAAQKQAPGVVQLLLDRAADPNIPDAYGRAPIWYALFHGDIGIAQKLADAGAKAGGLDHDNRTALDYAMHFVDGKDLRACVDLAKAAGARDISSRDREVAPMRSDPDFAALEVLRRGGWRHLIRRAGNAAAFFLVIGAALSLTRIIDPYDLGLWVWMLSLIGQYADLLGRLQYPIFIFDAVPLFSIPDLLLLPLGGLIGFFVFAWPVVRRRRAARRARSAHKPTESVSVNEIAKAGPSARLMSGLLKANSERFSEFDRDEANLDGKHHRNALLAIFVLCAVPWLAAVVFGTTCAIVMLFFGSYLVDPFGFYDLLEFALCAVFSAAALVAALALGQRWAAQLFSARLIARQTIRRQKMDARLADDTASEAGQTDGGIVLFLRAFRLDKRIMVGRFNFETALAYHLSQSFDVVALGAPEDDLGPVNFRAGDQDWERKVIALAEKAQMIVMIPAPTEGVLRELVLLRDAGWLEKTIFVAPPSDASTHDEIAAMWDETREKVAPMGLQIPEHVAKGFIFSLDASGRLDSWDVLGMHLDPPHLAAEPTEVDANSSSDDHDTLSHFNDLDVQMANEMAFTSAMMDTEAALQAMESVAQSSTWDDDHHHHHHDDHHRL